MNRLSDDELLDELKRRFNQQKQSLEELERLNKTLKELNKKLEESERLKSHFLSNIRNEIINPFASIIGLAQNIQKLGTDKIDKIHQMAAMIHSEAFALDFQLQNIFAAAEIEAGEITPQYMNVDINNICKSVIEAFQHEISKKNITINYQTCNEGLIYRTDPQKVRIIFANILSNSIKYSNQNSTIDIFVDNSDKLFSIIVKDYGKGIEKENIKTIFDRFKRIDDTINTLNSGYGLGLSVVSAFLDILGGTISVETEKDKGSKFIVHIPEAPKENIEDIAMDSNEFLFEDDGETF